jgi:hypothetical protein
LGEGRFLFSICSVILLVGLAYLINVISELARKAFLLWSTGFSPQKCPVPAVHAVLKDQLCVALKD